MNAVSNVAKTHLFFHYNFYLFIYLFQTLKYQVHIIQITTTTTTNKKYTQLKVKKLNQHLSYNYRPNKLLKSVCGNERQCVKIK